MPIGERAGRDHDAVLAPIAAKPQPLTQALHHGQMSLLPGVVRGCAVPAHAGQDAAVRAGEKATRGGGDRRQRDYIWDMPKCKTCDDTEWVCENHTDRHGTDSTRADVSAGPALLTEI